MYLYYLTKQSEMKPYLEACGCAVLTRCDMVICWSCAQVHRLSPDFPDALCELLFALQEGRRLNDQRCSFRLEHRRRCYSEPSTPRHSQRGEAAAFIRFFIIIVGNISRQDS